MNIKINFLCKLKDVSSNRKYMYVYISALCEMRVRSRSRSRGRKDEVLWSTHVELFAVVIYLCERNFLKVI